MEEVWSLVQVSNIGARIKANLEAVRLENLVMTLFVMTFLLICARIAQILLMVFPLANWKEFFRIPFPSYLRALPIQNLVGTH